MADLITRIQSAGRLELSVDLEARQISIVGDASVSYPFEVAESVRANLLQGLDEIALTLESDETIGAFESTHNVQL